MCRSSDPAPAAFEGDSSGEGGFHKFPARSISGCLSCHSVPPEGLCANTLLCALLVEYFSFGVVFPRRATRDGSEPEAVGKSVKIKLCVNYRAALADGEN